MQVIPYFSFLGNAAEAIELYNKAFRGKTTYISYYKDNEEVLKEHPDYADKIMHASIEIDGGHFFLADDRPRNVGNNIAVNINFDTIEKLDYAFGVLKEEGDVKVELEDTFWGARYGFVIDKFGNGWSLNYQYPKE